MNENINLCELLKGHEGETFYSPLCGDCILENSNNEEYVTIYEGYRKSYLDFEKDGRFYKEGECLLFPSKDQRDWNKWAEEQKPEVPKTWGKDVKIANAEVWNNIAALDYGSTEPIIKSALALLKIRQLIEVGYGGNVTKEWNNDNIDKYCIVCYRSNDYDFQIESYRCTYSHIAFHTQKQAIEFLSYPDNEQLVKDFYML